LVGDGGDDFYFAFGAGEAFWAAIAEADEVEHRFLRSGLRFFVAGEDGEDDGFAREAVGVAGVESGVEGDECVEISEGLAGKGGVGVGAVEVAAEAETEFELAVGGSVDAGHGVAACGGG